MSICEVWIVKHRRYLGTGLCVIPALTVSEASWLKRLRAELKATQRYKPSSSLVTPKICSTPLGRDMYLRERERD